MARKDDVGRGLSRREFLEASGVTTLALGTGALSGLPTMATAAQSGTQATGPTGGGPFNILFILTDQERYFGPSALPPGYTLPGRERLKRRGVNFTNHHINSAVCTSSRSVIYTGQHIQHTKLFDNMHVPWMKDLSHDIPTLGDMLSEAGYYAAYKGKWHMSKELGTHNEQALPQEKLTKVIESYGFKDYVGIGDVIGETRGGYLMTTSSVLRLSTGYEAMVRVWTSRVSLGACQSTWLIHTTPCSITLMLQVRTSRVIPRR